MPDPKLKVTIETAATGNGAAKTAGEIRDVGNAAKNTGGALNQSATASKNAGKAVNELGENFEKGASAGRIFAQAASGNVDALFQLAPAIKAVGAALKANLVGVLITVGALAAQLLVPVIRGFMATKDAMDTTAKGAEEARKKIAEVDTAKLKFDEQKAQLASLQTRFESAQKAADQLYQTQERLRDANLGLKIAQIGAAEQRQLAQPGLSDAQKTLVKAQAEAERTKVRTAAAEEKAQADLTKALEDRRRAEKELEAAATSSAKVLAEQEKVVRRASEMQQRAGELGVKSDQQVQLDRMDALEKEIAARKKTLEEMYSNPSVSAGIASQGGDPGTVFAAWESAIAKQRKELLQLQNVAQQNQAIIGRGEATFAGAKETTQAQLERVQKAAAKNPNEATQKALADAEEAARLAGQLEQAEKQKTDALQRISDESASQQKVIDDLKAKLDAANATVKVAQLGVESAGLISRTDKTKAANSLADARSGLFSESLQKAKATIDSAQPAEVEKIGQVSEEFAAAFSQDREQTRKSVDQTVGRIANATSNLPAPADLTPVATAIEKQTEVMAQKFGELQGQVDGLSRRVQQNANQIAQLRSRSQ